TRRSSDLVLVYLALASSAAPGLAAFLKLSLPHLLVCVPAYADVSAAVCLAVLLVSGSPTDDSACANYHRLQPLLLSSAQPRVRVPLLVQQTFLNPFGLFLALLQTLSGGLLHACETVEQNLRNPLPRACLPCR